MEVLPGVFVNGELTIGENIADMGGLQIAHDALQAALAEDGDPGLIEGLTQDQRFFLANAYRWAEKARDEFLATLVQTDITLRRGARGAAVTQHGRLLRGVRHQAGRPDVSAAGGAHRHLVATLPAVATVRSCASASSGRSIEVAELA